MKYFILAILALYGCSDSSPGNKELVLVGNIVKNRLKSDFNLIPFGSGAMWPNKCRAIEYDFNYRGRATISEARILMVNAVQVIVDSARSVKNFEQYLADPPFTEKHIMMGIGFDNPLPCINRTNDPQIKLATITFGMIRYKIWNEGAYRYDSVHEETYAEALQILENERR